MEFECNHNNHNNNHNHNKNSNNNNSDNNHNNDNMNNNNNKHCMFKTSKNDHVIEVNLNDDIDFICPRYDVTDTSPASSSSSSSSSLSVMTSSQNVMNVLQPPLRSLDDRSNEAEYYIVYMQHKQQQLQSVSINNNNYKFNININNNINNINYNINKTRCSINPSQFQHSRQNFVAFLEKVKQKDYKNCVLSSRDAVHTIVNCSNPYRPQPKRFTMSFESISTIPNNPEFQAGSTYYFIG
ncbi:hypothetical protein HELRODRAFT_188210 [Helobdella robusta]|uniref:Ephrin RBD domain-containing protein n=1 Tax=Helobdella robusta TaxID=6412 RepID=T1FPS2_HELRO|nr:hypothetical protein HELRODRAFT_188210 [Helobdella robusta]ESO05874.1 hypothetical protein HELRODRAFT_188210 [Helobdella robusta]